MKNTAQKTYDIHVAVVIRLLAVFLLFSLSRLVFFAFNTKLFPGIHWEDFFIVLIHGVRFDVAAISMVNALYVFLQFFPLKLRYTKAYQKFCNTVFYVFNGLALAFNFIDVIYFRFTLKRTTGDIFNYLALGDDIPGLIPQFLKDFWYILFIWVLSVFAIIYIVKKFKIRKPTVLYTWKIRLRDSLLLVVILLITVIGIRGGLQLKPIGIITAGKYVETENMPLVLNTPFTIIKTLNKQPLYPVLYFKNKPEQPCKYSSIHNLGSLRNSSSNNWNICIIILESFSAEHSKYLNPALERGNYSGFTPFLDSLMGQSLVFKGFANGKRSIEAMHAIIAGFPLLMDKDYISSPYAGNKINGIASLLKEKGYTSAFYHGGKNGTMGFDVFTRAAGVEHYYGKKEYNNEKDFDGKWGIYDEEFLQYVTKSLNDTKKPFFATVFTLSAHHPYTLPAKYEGAFPKGNLLIQPCIAYTDFSLKRFFNTASKMPWYKNTLFVITADHTSEAYYPEYQTRVGAYQIPIIFYKPNSEIKGLKSQIVQQTDIMPTILDLIKYDKPYVAFGNSVFDTTADRFAISYSNMVYQLIMNNFVLHFDGEKSIALYDFAKDNMLSENLIQDPAYTPITNHMECVVKSIIQDYNYRMIYNKMTIK